MDLRTVRWFLTVADHGHVTQAAEDLQVSQPGLSRAIGRLEHELGVPLFDRVGRRVVLSRYGALFAEHARRLVAEQDAAVRSLAAASDPSRGEVTLAFLHTQGAALVPDLVRRYRGVQPHVRFRLMQASSAGIAAAVLDGTADLGIVSPRPDDAALAWHPLVEERLGLAVPPDHRLAQRRRVRLAEVADEPFILMREGYGLRTIADELLAQAGVRPVIAFEGEEAVTVRGLVVAGLGVAILPALPHDLHITDPGAVRTIGVTWHRDRTRLPTAEAFRRFTTAPRA
jgi:DNA-binding transcriptional LysR family regulator